jgi:SAM-dependent methyltransferase
MKGQAPRTAYTAAYLRLSVTYRRAILNDWLQRWQNHMRGIVLDVGGERFKPECYVAPAEGQAAPLRRACGPNGVDRWLYLNLNPVAVPDIVADGACLPLATGAVDTVVCLETLEHVVDPQQVVREMARVLRPGGTLLLSVPFLYRIHAAPNDLWRFTEYQVLRMVQQAGLQVVQLKRLGLWFTVMGDLTKQAIGEIRWGPLRWLLGGLFLPLGALLVSLERLGLGQHSAALATFSTGYLVLATKPGEKDG